MNVDSLLDSQVLICMKISHNACYLPDASTNTNIDQWRFWRWILSDTMAARAAGSTGALSRGTEPYGRL